MRAAAVRGDAASLSSHVDFPRLRESLKGWLSAAMLKRATEEQNTGAAALGALFAGGPAERYRVGSVQGRGPWIACPADTDYCRSWLTRTTIGRNSVGASGF